MALLRNALAANDDHGGSEQNFEIETEGQAVNVFHIARELVWPGGSVSP
jgi:hypothetical protein